MEDVIGYGGYGYDIIGAGQGYPQGDAFYPVNQYGQGVYAAPQPGPLQQLVARGQQLLAPDQFAGRAAYAQMGRAGQQYAQVGGDLDGGACLGPLEAPLAVQLNQQPLVGLAPRCPTRVRTEFAGLGGCTIDPCGTVTLRCSPCVLMKIIRFVIPSSIAFQLTVDQITINGKETLINCGPVPAAMFIEDATFIETIQTETIQPGCCIEIQLTNTSNAPVDAIIGCVVRAVW